MSAAKSGHERLLANGSFRPIADIGGFADDQRMIGLVMLALAASTSASDHPRLFLASIKGVRLRSGESIDEFNLDTWGVDFKAVCHIPADWEITAGSFGPGGKLAGEAGHGASQLRVQDMNKLSALVLIGLDGPVQKRDIRDRTGIVPATFGGFAHVQSGWTERSRKVSLTYANVRLTPARACPSLRDGS